jgi:hypothetical protein
MPIFPTPPLLHCKASCVYKRLLLCSRGVGWCRLQDKKVPERERKGRSVRRIHRPSTTAPECQSSAGSGRTGKPGSSEKANISASPKATKRHQFSRGQEENARTRGRWMS